MINRKLFVLALDGVPYTLITQFAASGIMPNIRSLIEEGSVLQIDSVQPPVSSVAWASFMTGLKPGEHGIYGFVDRDPLTMDWYTPLTDRLKGKTIWEVLSEYQKRVFVMNVPMTYPPRKVNGISICGFLGGDITKGTYPLEIGTLLKSRGYRIDADTELAKKDLLKFFYDLEIVLKKRVETMWYFWKREPWDFFMTHIMETDRLHHFFWEYYEDKTQPWYDLFIRIYNLIDNIIGQIVDSMPKETGLLLLSDHGFTTLKKEFYLNRWLSENGYLSFNQSMPSSLKKIDESSIAYSLYPGRIYINLKGREICGSVSTEIEYEQYRRMISNQLMNLSDPDTGNPIVLSVLNGEEVFSNSRISKFRKRSFIDIQRQQHPDLMVVANKGYDIKGILTSEQLFKKQHFNGMHTIDNAFLLGKNIKIPDKRISIDHISQIIYDYMEIEGF
jgi:predicted AlkP superfamily phosphohydrolase/phosphomutase